MSPSVKETINYEHDEEENGERPDKTSVPQRDTSSISDEERNYDELKNMGTGGAAILTLFGIAAGSIVESTDNDGRGPVEEVGNYLDGATDVAGELTAYSQDAALYLSEHPEIAEYTAEIL